MYDKFMMKALHLAQAAKLRGDFGVGALLVHEGKVIAQASNKMVSHGLRAWAHPEAIILSRLEDTQYDTPTQYRRMTLFTTLAPCPQCWGMCLVRGIGKIVVGARDPFSEPDYCSVPETFSSQVPQIEYCGGIIAEQCRILFHEDRGRLDQLFGFKTTL